MHAEHALSRRWPERAAAPPARAVPSYGWCCRCRTWAVQWHFYDDPTANQPRPPDGPTEMNSSFKTCLALAASSVLLVACGGGNDDDPTPSNEPGVLTVTSSTVDGLNGIYGNGSLNITDVDKKNPVGSSPEVCTFKFDGANKVGSDATAFGDIRYQVNGTVTYQVFMTFAGKEYASGEAVDTAVERESDRVRFTSKTLTASDGSGATLKVSGIVPMRTGRPSGC